MSCQLVYYRRETKDRSPMALTSSLIALIMMRPSTPRELALKLTTGALTDGVVDNIRRHLSYLHNFGVVRVAGRRKCGKRMALVFAMQATPFAVEDDTLTELDGANNAVC